MTQLLELRYITLKFWGNVYEGSRSGWPLSVPSSPSTVSVLQRHALSVSPPLWAAVLLRPRTSWAPACAEIYCPNLCNQAS